MQSRRQADILWSQWVHVPDRLHPTTEDSCLPDITITDPHPTNLSTHVVVTAKLEVSQSDLKIKARKPKQPTSVRKFHWDKMDEPLYQQTLQTLLAECNFEVNTDNYITLLTSILSEAAGKAVPRKQVKLKGPNFKLSPAVRVLERQSKIAHFNGRMPDAPLWTTPCQYNGNSQNTH